MYRLTGIMTSTHVDRHGDRMMLSALEDGVKQINAGYLPFGVEHDPRIAPIGRVVAARIKELEDGEYGLEGEIEIFETGDALPLREDGRQIPLRTYPVDRLQVVYDMAFQDDESKALIDEISKQLGTEPTQESKKSLEPIAVMIIGGGAFILGQLAKGFFSRLGQDGYEALKVGLKKLFQYRQSCGKDTLLEVSLIVPIQGHDVEVDILCKNPSSGMLDDVLKKQLQRIDETLPTLVDPRHGIRKLVFEHEDGNNSSAIRRASGCSSVIIRAKKSERRGKGDKLLFWKFSGTPAFLEHGREAKRDCGGCLPVCCPEGLLPVDTGTQQSEFMSEQRLINPLKPRDWNKKMGQATFLPAFVARPRLRSIDVRLSPLARRSIS